MKMKNLFILVVILFLLAGCANLNSIYRENLLTNKGHFIDAKQRVIYSSDQGGIKKVCAEPSPDVLSALAASFERSSNKDSAEISESVDQISRIATTELIRERLYRACEAYFNGALTSSAYESVQADFALTSSALLAIDRLGAGLGCKTKKLASVKADIDPKSGEKDEEDEEGANKNKKQDTEYRCSHLDAQSVGHITTAIENIIETVNIYSDKNKTRLIAVQANRTFESFVGAIKEDKGYNQVTDGIAKLKRQPLISQIYNFREDTDATKCERRKIEITNQFIAYWDTYIAPSFIRYLNDETNDIDLSPNQLGEAFTELSAAINAVRTLSADESTLFILPNPNADNQDANPQAIEDRKTGISNIIQGFDCTSPTAETETSDQ